MSDVRRIGVDVRGRVQGVGFRYFVLTAARRLGIDGWVRNEPDGSVRCEAQGDATALAEFTAELRRGPRYARVDAVEEHELDPAGAVTGFEIR